MEQLNTEQKQALSLMLSGKNCFLTGQAGTGKSTVIQAFRECCQVPFVVLAPTGIAAVNVNGQTIHSFFSFPPELLTIDTLQAQKMFFPKKKLIQAVKTIIIDEISMVRSDVFYAIDYRLRELARGPNKNKKFGGKQIIVCGDFFQLAPVVTETLEMEFLRTNCQGVYSFQTNLWKEADFQVCWLRTPHRQSADGTFVKVLDNIRRGDLQTKNIIDGMKVRSSIDVLNDECLSRKTLPTSDPIKLCTTNSEATNINASARAKLKSTSYRFNAVVSGTFPQSEFPTECQLELMVGARVMILCNKRLTDKTFQCANGDIGVIESIVDGADPKVTVLLDKDGSRVCLSMHQWNKTKYKLEKDVVTNHEKIVQEIIGSFLQLPLKLAYAITIHKSQGLTLDNVDLKLGNGCFSHGQLYTALSRCRTLSGLLLERPVMQDDLVLDQNVIDFYKSIDNSSLQSPEKTYVEVPKNLESKIRQMIQDLKEKNSTI